MTHDENHGPLYYQLTYGDEYDCDYGQGLVDISGEPTVELRMKASSPVQIHIYIQEGNNPSWDYSRFSETVGVINLTTDWQVIEIPNISTLSTNGKDHVDLTSIGGLAFELGKTDGESYDEFDGTVSVDYMLFGAVVSCENKVAEDTTVVNYKNHEETPKTISFVNSNTFQLKNGCDSTVSNYEYYCEEAIRRDTNFVVTSNFSLSNYTQFELSQIIGQNRNGCDSLVYTYTSYVYCKPKETEETILIKTVNSTIFDDETDLFSSFTYQTEEGCDSIHSIYKHYEYSPNTVDTVYQTDTIYEIGTDTVFIKNTACDTLVIDLRGVTSTEYLASEFNLKVYPNPSSEILYLDYTKPASYTDALSLTIFDNSGRAIIQQQLPNNTIKTVDLSTMAAGTYFIIIYNSSFNKVAEAPFVVNK